MTRPTAAEVEAKSARNRADWKPPVTPLTHEIAAIQKIYAQPKKPTKYRNIKTTEGDSRKEVGRLQELRWLQREGKIVHLASQVRYTLIPKQLKADGTHERAMTYTCDAQYLQEGALVVEDTKSEATRKLPRYVAARKLMLQLFNIEIQEM